jgi:hypothetical protein
VFGLVIGHFQALFALSQMGRNKFGQREFATVLLIRTTRTGTQFTLARGKNPSQRSALKSVRGSNHGRFQVRRTIGKPEKNQEFSAKGSGSAVCVAPAAQQADSRTGAKENR